ncbi:hypothetical protein B0O99DRAFT_18500 [Bisporella sp. PMI_857]|nr:hypothetical protein B0O99DRAFT_18500 [Bisporella sp. PMI_857]
MTTVLPSSTSEAAAPLPDFVFPARPSPSSSAPSSFSRATGRRQLSPTADISGSFGRLDNSSRQSPPAELPQFSFNPSEPVESGIASPPLSPQHRSIPSRTNFHKRGTSEYIGGDGKTGSGLGLMSTSPTKGDNVLPTPNTLSALGPQPGRRGHAHRRSAAISQGDLSFMIKPTDPTSTQRGGSAPCSPSVEDKRSPFPGIESISNYETEQGNTASRVTRTRVGFSDDVQFIPRPLSVVSSESSGTTIRPGGHSVSGSISSIISASSPSTKEQRQSPETDARPKTAAARLDSSGPISPTLDATGPRRRRSNPLLPAMISSAPETPPTPKSPNKIWSFFSGTDSPNSRPTSAASYKDPQPAPKSPIPQTPDVPIASTEIEPAPSRRSSIASRKKKQKKVKSWAGSILSRKARQRSSKHSRRSPTPPNPAYTSMESSVTELKQLEPTIPESASLVKPEINTDFSSWVPRRTYVPDDESTMSPIIDLDAALGPFNTPSGRDAEWEAVTGSGPRRGKRMHSAAGMSNFGGPGMHYHRRAASSPELENPRFGMRHLNSSSTMADVFEEDEEDDWEDSKSSVHGKTEDEEESGIDIKVVDADDESGEKIMDWTIDDEESSKRGIKRKGSGLSEGGRRHISASMKSTASSNSLKDETILEETPSRTEIFDDSINSRPVSSAQSSESTATPPLRSRLPKDLAPVDIQPFSLQPPYLTPTSPQSTTHSSMPSPRSPFSYDTQRISTAPSSVADEGGFQSLLLGEPGPELRMSTDIYDVPSLTDSNSTMTRDSMFIPVANSPQFREGQRSASFSAAVRNKRSSMASLSRLISSSHGEKSKLSMEVRAPSLDTERKEKSSKPKRFSRLMQFWKPKDST